MLLRDHHASRSFGSVPRCNGSKRKTRTWMVIAQFALARTVYLFAHRPLSVIALEYARRCNSGTTRSTKSTKLSGHTAYARLKPSSPWRYFVGFVQDSRVSTTLVSFHVRNGLSTEPPKIRGLRDPALQESWQRVLFRRHAFPRSPT